MAERPCHHCGYELAGTALIHGLRWCPECGEASPDRPRALPWWIKNAVPLLVAIGPLCAFVSVQVERTGRQMWGYKWSDKHDWTIGISTLVAPSVICLLLIWRIYALAAKRGIPFPGIKLAQLVIMALAGSTLACFVSYLIFAAFAGFFHVA